MRLRVLRLALLLAFGTIACAALKEASPDAPGDAGGAATPGDDDTANGEGGPNGDPDGSTPPATDATDADSSSTDAGSDGAVGPTGLDPSLPIPELDAATCDQPGNPSVCGGVAACRFATPESGRCETCPVGSCETLIGHACTKSIDCDIDLECYRGKCTLTCRFPYQGECGGVRKCIDVGFEGPYGVCDANPPY